MDRLTAADLVTLWPEERGWPQDIGALVVLDGDALLDAQGALRLPVVCAAIEARLPRVPRFRQVVTVPRRGLGRPFWSDHTAFDVAEHVGAQRLTGDDALLAAVEQLRRHPLPRSRPLWQMWFLTGLAGRRVALYVRVHHVLGDGPSAVAMLGAFLDPSPDPPAEPPRPWRPAPLPTARALFVDAWRGRWAALARARALPRPTWAVLREGCTAWRTPSTSLNRAVGPDRAVALVHADLDQVRRVAHAHGATVNDVLLTAVTGGLRALLEYRGEPLGTAVLRAMVPVSLHRLDAGGPHGNRLGSMVVPLPVGEPDPAAALGRIAADTAARKRRVHPRLTPVVRSRTLQRAALTALERQRVFHVHVADVPGQVTPLWFAGARLREVYVLPPLMGNLTLAVGAFSYAGLFDVAVVGDRDACPDLDVFAAGLRERLGSASSGS